MSSHFLHFSLFFFFLFFFFLFHFFFFQIVPMKPSRLCRHPSIRTLGGAMVARCQLGVLDSVGAAT